MPNFEPKKKGKKKETTYNNKFWKSHICFIHIRLIDDTSTIPGVVFSPLSVLTLLSYIRPTRRMKSWRKCVTNPHPWLMHFLFYLTINPQFKKRVFSNNSSPIKHLKLCVNYHLNAYIFYPDNFHVKLFGIVFFKISSLVFQNPTIFLHSPSTEHFNWFNTLFKKGNIKSQIKMIKI